MCPSLELIAAAASGAAADDGDAATVLAHAVACPRCAALLAEQRQLRSFASRLSVPTLDRDRRAELAAEVMARADAAPRERRMVRIAFAASLVVAIAATFVIVLAMRGMGDSQVAIAPPVPDRPALGSNNPPPVRTPVVDRLPSPPPADEPVLSIAAGSRIARTPGIGAGPELVEITDGNVTIDTQKSRDVAVTAGATRVAVGRAKAAVVAKRGVIESVHVFAGSVEITANGKKRVISAGTVWRSTELLEPKPEVPKAGSAAPEPAPTASELALKTFREGYVALRAGRNADAIAAFDRATDPVVAEDATFWAAVASDRFGDTDDAVRRYTAFLAKFPGSPRTGDAKAAIARLGKQPAAAPESKGL